MPNTLSVLKPYRLWFDWRAAFPKHRPCFRSTTTALIDHLQPTRISVLFPDMRSTARHQGTGNVPHVQWFVTGHIDQQQISCPVHEALGMIQFHSSRLRLQALLLLDFDQHIAVRVLGDASTSSRVRLICPFNLCNLQDAAEVVPFPNHFPRLQSQIKPLHISKTWRAGVSACVGVLTEDTPIQPSPVGGHAQGYMLPSLNRVSVPVYVESWGAGGPGAPQEIVHTSSRR